MWWLVDWGLGWGSCDDDSKLCLCGAFCLG